MLCTQPGRIVDGARRVHRGPAVGATLDECSAKGPYAVGILGRLSMRQADGKHEINPFTAYQAAEVPCLRATREERRGDAPGLVDLMHRSRCSVLPQVSKLGRR